MMEQCRKLKPKIYGEKSGKIFLSHFEENILSIIGILFSPHNKEYRKYSRLNSEKKLSRKYTKYDEIPHFPIFCSNKNYAFNKKVQNENKFEEIHGKFFCIVILVNFFV